MNDRVAETAAPTTRLGQLQRGRGAGFQRALAAGAAAHDDVLQCLIEDPRVDRQDEDRARYYAELVVALAVPLEPLVRHLAGQPPALAHEVLAGSFCLGHGETRELLAGRSTDEQVIVGVTDYLWGRQWARLVDLPRRPAAAFLRRALDEAQCAVASRGWRDQAPAFEASLSTEQLLELARQNEHEHRREVVSELCRRTSEKDVGLMAHYVEHDVVYGRVRLAARVLGMLGDERLLPLAEDYFSREDVVDDPRRRLSGYERMRRSALGVYVGHLPEPRQLALARKWHARGGYRETVAGSLLAAQATADDRILLEAFLADRCATDTGRNMISEIDALARIGDPASLPLLVQVAEQAAYSPARHRALHGLAGMAELPGAAAALREALWDCQDEAAADACAFLPQLDPAAAARVRTLADHALAAPELHQRAARRLHRLG